MYVPLSGSQFKPLTTFSSVDCVPQTCAEAADRASVGAMRTTHAAIRNASTDRSGGMTYGDAVKATEKVTGIKGEPRYSLSRDEVRKLCKAGHALTVSIDCSVTVNTKYATNRYTGGHSVFANSYAALDDTFMVQDPGTTSAGYLRWPAALLLAAAEKRTNGHGVNTIVWPDTEGRSWKAVMTGRIRATPETDGKDLGKIVLGTTYRGGRTENGGTWTRKDGTTADGWVHVQYAASKWGWVRGEALR